jgi:Na+/proline symporter
MIQIIGLMAAAYVFTRMLIFSLREYPNETKSTRAIIHIMAILTALFAVACAFLLLVQGTDLDPTKYLK